MYPYLSNWCRHFSKSEVEFQIAPSVQPIVAQPVFLPSQEQFQWDREIATGRITSLDISQILQTMYTLYLWVYFVYLFDILYSRLAVWR